MSRSATSPPSTEPTATAFFPRTSSRATSAPSLPIFSARSPPAFPEFIWISAISAVTILLLTLLLTTERLLAYTPYLRGTSHHERLHEPHFARSLSAIRNQTPFAKPGLDSRVLRRIRHSEYLAFPDSSD